MFTAFEVSIKDANACYVSGRKHEFDKMKSFIDEDRIFVVLPPR